MRSARAAARPQGLERSKRIFAYCVVVPAAIYMLFWNVIPYAWVVVLSLFEYSPGRAGGPFLGLGGNNPFVGFANFRDALSLGAASEISRRAQEFRVALKNTLVFAALDVPLNLAITLPLAVLAGRNREGKASAALRTVFFLPIVTSSVAIGVMWGYIFHPQQGALNGLLSALSGHTMQIAWLQDANFQVFGINVALFCILAAYLWGDFGYNFIIFSAALRNIPSSVLEAAELDGAVGATRFFKLILPIMKPQILLTSILTAISAFQVFDLVQVLCPWASPDKQTLTLIFSIFDSAFRYRDMGFASAQAIVFFLIILAVSIVQKRLLRSDWEY